MTEQNKVALSKKQCAERLSVSVDTVNRVIKKGKIRVLYFGRRVLIPASELERIVRGE